MNLFFTEIFFSALLELRVHVPLKASYSQPHLCTHLDFHSRSHVMSSPQQFECAAEQNEIRQLRDVSSAKLSLKKVFFIVKGKPMLIK